MNTSEVQDSLRRCPLFQEFTDTELQAFLDLLDPLQAKDGQCIVRQDDQGDSMYLLVGGQVKVMHHKDGQTVQLALLSRGDFFGELALMDRGPRSADVEAVGDTTLLEITQATLSALAGVYPGAAFKFLWTIGRILVSRLRQTNQRYVDSLLIHTASKF